MQHAAAKKAGEALWFTVTNHLAGGSVSNAFLVRDGVLLTPPARGEQSEDTPAWPVLPGITRAAIIELAQADGIETIRRKLDVSDILDADEVFLTNSSWGVLPVTGVEREKVGDGSVGPVTADLRAAWLEVVERETSE